jgi:hemoglobin
MRLGTKLAAIAASSLLALGACGGKKSGSTTTAGGGGGSATLYDRLGGQPAVAKVVDDFVTNVAGDTRINKFFTAAAGDPQEMAHFKQMLADQICAAAGGGCKYTGKQMPEAHKDMKITHDQFMALVEDLEKAATADGVKDADLKELVGALAPLEPQIVGQ